MKRNAIVAKAVNNRGLYKSQAAEKRGKPQQAGRSKWQCQVKQVKSLDARTIRQAIASHKDVKSNVRHNVQPIIDNVGGKEERRNQAGQDRAPEKYNRQETKQ